jgi:hypothetical protein
MGEISAVKDKERTYVAEILDKAVWCRRRDSSDALGAGLVSGAPRSRVPGRKRSVCEYWCLRRCWRGDGDLHSWGNGVPGEMLIVVPVWRKQPVLCGVYRKLHPEFKHLLSDRKIQLSNGIVRPAPLCM